MKLDNAQKQLITDFETILWSLNETSETSIERKNRKIWMSYIYLHFIHVFLCLFFRYWATCVIFQLTEQLTKT